MLSDERLHCDWSTEMFQRNGLYPFLHLTASCFAIATAFVNSPLAGVSNVLHVVLNAIAAVALFVTVQFIHWGTLSWLLQNKGEQRRAWQRPVAVGLALLCVIWFCTAYCLTALIHHAFGFGLRINGTHLR